MRRFLASLRRDVLLQVRYKLVAVSLFMVAFWSGLLVLVPEAYRPDPTLLVPAFVVINLLTTTFYFICGLVLSCTAIRSSRQSKVNFSPLKSEIGGWNCRCLRSNCTILKVISIPMIFLTTRSNGSKRCWESWPLRKNG